MEAQARGLAPRILMPKVAARIKIQELLDRREFTEEHPDRIEMLTSVVNELSEFFRVSKTAAKYRMVNLGYISNVDAEQIYPDDTLRDKELAITQQPLTVKPSNRPLTRHVDLCVAFEEYQKNEAFREILGSGNFRYVEGEFVLDDELYCVKNASGSYILTKYARDNPSKCALLFTYKVSVTRGKSPQMFDFPLPPDVVQMMTTSHYMTSVDTGYRKLPSYIPNNQSEDIRNEAARLNVALRNATSEFDQFVQERQTTASSPDFWTRVSQLMKIKNISKNKFKSLTLLDDNTISRTGGNAVNGGKPPQKLTEITLRVAMAVCVGLDLDLTQSKELLALAKLALNNEKECLAYEFILTTFKGCGIDERNLILEKWGLKPLGVRSAL